jgi:leader peptidase (prepilin peptidase)/N-methyltransferase
VHALLVTSGAVAGVVAGGLLDPVAQRLADHSRTAEVRRRAERAERRAAEASTAGPVPVPEVDVAGSGTVPDLPVATEQVRHLLPEGRSVPRTVSAALVTGALFAAVAAHFGQPGRTTTLWIVVPYWVFCAMAVAVSVTDLTHRLVPRQLIYAALALLVPLFVVVSAHDHAWRPLVDAAIAGVGGFAVFFLIWFFVPRGMGYGDVRLAGVIGVATGYLDLLHAYLGFLSGFVLGLVFGLVLMVGSRSGRKTRIPFAPALCAGAVVAILWGDPLVHHIFHAGT